VRWGLTAAAVCCIAALLAPSAAGAALRYAAPGGEGGEPCNPNPCSLLLAVNNAGDNDKVIVNPGHYIENGEIFLDRSIDVGGQPGGPVPIVDLAEKNLRIDNDGAVLHDMRIHMQGPAMAYTLVMEAGTIERAFVSAGEIAAPCQIEGGVVRDTVCWGGLYLFPGEPGTHAAILRNVTATPLLVGACCGADLTVDAANVIAQGLEPGQDDLDIDVNVMASASIVLSHSNYSSVDTSLSAGTNYSYTQPGANGNQIAEPLFVNAGAGDFRQLAGSPTIDAGASDPLIGALDLDGNPRSQPSCIGGAPVPDIGAYENAPTVACPKPSNRFKFGKLKRNKKKGTAKLPVSLPGPGKVSLSGKGVVGRTLSGSGTVKLLIKAKGKRKRTLERTGKVKLKAKVTFSPTGGDPNTRGKTVKLVKKLPGSGG
jgi:hypothetical protein